MAKLIPGGEFPRFRYDTPYRAQNRVAELYSEQPLFMVFLSNLGHPVTRSVLQDYMDSFAQLTGCGLACVVRSKPQTIAAAMPEGSLPFTVICDPEGELYRHFEIPTETSVFRYSSLKAMHILREAQKKGYRSSKGKPEQLPLTVLVDTDGTVLMAHYGSSLTDLPENCAAMTVIMDNLPPQPAMEAETEPQPLEDEAEAPAEGVAIEVDPEISAEEAALVPEAEPMPVEVEPANEPERPVEIALEAAAKQPGKELLRMGNELDSEGKPYTLESLFGSRE